MALTQSLAQSEEINGDTLELIYVMDPMCSWCYGFSPEIEQVKNKYDTVKNVTFTMIAGGLRPGSTEKMDKQMAGFLKHHWEQVNKRTGQPFSYKLLENETFVYDTENCDRALVLMRNLNASAVFDYVKAIQNAFYAESQDITDPEVLSEIAEKFGLNKDEFESQLLTEKTKQLTWIDFRYARDLSASGFPTLLAKKGGKYYSITIGYSEFKQIDKRIQKLL